MRKTLQAFLVYTGARKMRLLEVLMYNQGPGMKSWPPPAPLKILQSFPFTAPTACLECCAGDAASLRETHGTSEQKLWAPEVLIGLSYKGTALPVLTAQYVINNDLTHIPRMLSNESHGVQGMRHLCARHTKPSCSSWGRQRSWCIMQDPE